MQHSFSKYLPQNILIIKILLLGSIYLFHDSMDLDPAYVHSWTQSDRLAIAMNFQENGFDFFHPATYNLLTKDGVTQVDFPIHDYLIALISSFSGLDLSHTFRFYNLTFFLIGLFYFFQTCRLLRIDSLLAFAATIFIATLPFLVYYQNGFLPSIPSYAAFCIAAFYLLKSENSGEGLSYEIGIGFLALSALARIPFSIFLIALIASLGYISIRERQLKIRKLITPLLGLGMVLSYYFYNQYLASEYGSMFLSTFRTADDGGAFWQSVFDSIDRWSGQLISPFHLLLLLGVVYVYLSRLKKKDHQEKRNILKPLTLFSTVGVLLYYGLMSLQFVDHDYYYIDSFLPLFTLIGLLSLSSLRISDRWYAPAFAFIFICCFGMYSEARSNQDYRYESASLERVHYHYKVYEKAADKLDGWGVEKNDTIAVFDISSTNLPFISWRRRGYTSLSSGERSAKALLARSFDHAFIIDSFKVSDSYFDYPEIANQLAFVEGNGEISLYRKQYSNNIGQFFRSLYANARLDFEDTLKANSLKIREGAPRRILDDMKGHSLKLSQDTEYALTSEFSSSADHSIKLSIQFEVFPTDSLKGLQLVVSANNYYASYYLENEVKDYQDWQRLQFHKRISVLNLSGVEPLRIYFWNPEGSIAYIDNYEILLYE